MSNKSKSGGRVCVRWCPAQLAWAVMSACAPLAATAGDGSVFTLGQVEVVSTRQNEDTAPTARVDAVQLREQDRENAGTALSLLPGVILSRVGARNEQMVYVRGFDLRQVPVFIDGIPVYVPYDGYVDLGRFTTFDLSRIEVAKGFSSMVYGANTLGGAINLVSRRPAKALEAEGGFGTTITDHAEFGSTRSWANVGTRHETWYLQAGASYLDQSYFRLPADFTPVKTENGGRRENSYSSDAKANLKLALTPNAGDEYALNLISQHGEKGVPPYAGTVSGVTARYWRWPYWNKDSIYLLTNTWLGAHQLKTRVYHDVFKNSLYSYDDATYTTQSRPYAFRSWYNDFTNGASVEDDWQLAQDNTLKGALHWKEDVHRENNAGEPVRHFRDRTESLDAEDAQRLGDKLSVVGGLGYDKRDTLQAQDYNSTIKVVSDFARDNVHAFNKQIGAFYGSEAEGSYSATIADKSRFPTIKDRYSYRLGTAIPNASLQTERALHYEFGYTHALSEALRYDARVFYADITNLIQSVVISPPAGVTCSTPCSQMQNVGKASAAGAELDLRGVISNWRYDANYSYLSRRNRTGNGVQLTDTPHHKAFASVDTPIAGQWSAGATFEGMTRRYSSSDGKQVAPSYGIASLRAAWRPTAQLGIDLGVRNVFDRVYFLTEGFPEEGRTWYVNLSARI